MLAEASDGGSPEVILIATGSEVQLAVDGPRRCSPSEGIHARVVSMPCREWFDEQDAGVPRDACSRRP